MLFTPNLRHFLSQLSGSTVYRAASTYTPEELNKDLENIAIVPSHRPMLILDELHAMPRRTRDAFLVVMDQLAGQTPHPAIARLGITVCGLTNRAVIPPLRRRFPNQLQLGSFSEPELAQIIQLFSQKTKLQCAPEAAHRLAHVSFTPGRARTLFTEARNRAVALGRQLDEPLVLETLNAMQIDSETGLDSQHRALLCYLCESGQASQDSLRAVLGIDDEAAYQELEQLLIRLGYIVINSRGRKPTEAARKLVQPST